MKLVAGETTLVQYCDSAGYITIIPVYIMVLAGF